MIDTQVVTETKTLEEQFFKQPVEVVEGQRKELKVTFDVDCSKLAKALQEHWDQILGSYAQQMLQGDWGDPSTNRIVETGRITSNYGTSPITPVVAAAYAAEHIVDYYRERFSAFNSNSSGGMFCIPNYERLTQGSWYDGCRKGWSTPIGNLRDGMARLRRVESELVHNTI